MSKGEAEIYLEELPRRGKLLNWKDSKGCKVKRFCDGEEKEFEIVDYERNKKHHLTIKYNGKEFDISTDSFIRCQFSRILGKITKDFKIEVGTILKDNGKGITIIEKKYIKDNNGCNRKYYKYRCNNPECRFNGGRHYSIKDKKYKDELWVLEDNLLKGVGCSCCCPTPRIVVEGINDIPTTTPWMVKYFKHPEEAKKYTKASISNVELVCPDCGYKKNMEIRYLYNQGLACNKCSDGISYPNKFMRVLLTELGVNFKAEYTPDWIGDRRYDFYIPSMNLIIEMDGGLGHGNTVHPKSKKTIEETIEDDSYKDKKANENGLEVIRVDCDYGSKNRFEYIKNSAINSKLCRKLDLYKVNWIKIGQMSEKNLVKEVCDIKRNNPEMSTTYIGEIVKLEGQTIAKYLKQGTKLGWCNYDPKKEMQKSSSKAGRLNGKPVKIFKDGIELGEYASCNELERCSEKDFGVKLDNRMISAVCNGKRKQYKGFAFKYIKESIITELHKQELVQAS